MNIIKRIINSLKRNGFKRFTKVQFSKIGNWLSSLTQKKEINSDEVSFKLHSELIDKIYGTGLDLAKGKISNFLKSA